MKKSKNNYPILLLCGAFPDEEFQSLVLKNFQRAANVHQEAMITGLFSACENLTVVSVPFVGAFPKSFKYWLLQAFGITYSNNELVYFKLSKRVANLPFIRFLSRLYVSTMMLFRTTRKEVGTIIVYGAHTPFLISAQLLRLFHKELKLSIVITDLSQFMGVGNSRPNFITRILKKLDGSLQRFLLQRFDNFILLAEPMYDRLGLTEKAYIVEEGIFQPPKHQSVSNSTQFSRKHSYVFCYSGGLSIRNGVKDLVDCFMDPNCEDELVIFGYGELEGYLQQASEKCSNISFEGFISRDEIFERYTKVDVFINPRNSSSGDFVRYSFPSKLMEYFSLGKPVLSYKLPGIPNSYDEFFFPILSPGVDGLVNAIESFKRLSESAIVNRCENAANFVKSEKTPVAVGNRIARFLQPDDE